jgi:hypothetical protein
MKGLETYDCEQGTEEWLRVRMGIPTASMFSTVMASGKGGAESKTRRKYLLQLAGEILTGEPMETYSNAHMERGKLMEDEARRMYAFQKDAELNRVGFIRNGNKGCSPDALLGLDGMLEIKTTAPHLLIDIFLRGEFPPEHRHQCQGGLWIAERKWIDIAIYWPKMPLFVQRIHRDEAFISSLKIAVDEFNAELADIVQRMRRHG